MDWKEAYDRLKAYPNKRLGTTYFDYLGMRCAIGAISGGCDGDEQRTVCIQNMVALPGTVQENDSFEGTPEERYEYMLAFFKEQSGLT